MSTEEGGHEKAAVGKPGREASGENSRGLQNHEEYLVTVAPADKYRREGDKSDRRPSCPEDGRGIGAGRGHGRGAEDAWAQRAAGPACAGLRVRQQRGGVDGTARRVLRDEAGEVG